MKKAFSRYQTLFDERLPWIKYCFDLGLWVAVVPVAFWVRLEEGWEAYAPMMVTWMLIGLPVKATVILWLKLHRRSWHRLGVRDLFALLLGVGGTTGVLMLVAWAPVPSFTIPRSIPLIEGMLAMLLLSGLRLGVRLWYERLWQHAATQVGVLRRVLIVGAGEAGTMIAREILRHPQAARTPIGFLDDNPVKQRKRFVGLPVLGGIEDLPHLVKSENIDEIMIAMPSQSGRIIRRVVEFARMARVEHRIIPGIYEVLSGKVSISQIREVDLEDLLRREPVRLDITHISEYLQGKVVLVTGAGGSIGSEIVRQVARFKPKHLVLLGRGENSIYQSLRNLRESNSTVEASSVIADVRDQRKLDYVFRTYQPDAVFHAAAHKHVPLMEMNPDEAVLNNIVGTRNVAELALRYGVQRLVNISTDKAVNPSSIMGASKRMAEYVVEWVSQRASPGHDFVSVRFGNVLGSRGSVIPIFKEQIKKGGPVTITDAEMKRYFMTIPEAAQLVLQAGALGGNGNVYVLDMGEPVRIVDLAYDLIRLSGLEPEIDIPIEFSGVRPGEKLFEELLTAEEGTEASRHQQIYVARKQQLDVAELQLALRELIQAAEQQEAESIREIFASVIPVNTIQGELVA